MWPFRIRCPVTPADEAWVHRSACRLRDALGLERIRATPVARPGSGHLPPIDHPDDATVEAVFYSLCELAGVDPWTVRLRLFDDRGAELQRHLGVLPVDDDDRCPLGTYEIGPPPVINVSRENLQTSVHLVATIGHEIAHHVLLSVLGFDADDEDHEPLTDLAMIFLGSGWFGAHGSVYDRQWPGATIGGWQIGRGGYIPEPLWGYGLAVFAWMRDERDPAWTSGLSATVRGTVRKGLRYLAMRAESGIDPLSGDDR